MNATAASTRRATEITRSIRSESAGVSAALSRVGQIDRRAGVSSALSPTAITILTAGGPRLQHYGPTGGRPNGHGPFVPFCATAITGVIDVGSKGYNDR